MITAVDFSKVYRLLNDDPTVLVSSQQVVLRNVIAAAWNMPLDFELI